MVWQIWFGRFGLVWSTLGCLHILCKLRIGGCFLSLGRLHILGCLHKFEVVFIFDVVFILEVVLIFEVVFKFKSYPNFEFWTKKLDIRVPFWNHSIVSIERKKIKDKKNILLGTLLWVLKHCRLYNYLNLHIYIPGLFPTTFLVKKIGKYNPDTLWSHKILIRNLLISFFFVKAGTSWGCILA